MKIVLQHILHKSLEFFPGRLQSLLQAGVGLGVFIVKVRKAEPNLFGISHSCLNIKQYRVFKHNREQAFQKLRIILMRVRIPVANDTVGASQEFMNHCAGRC